MQKYGISLEYNIYLLYIDEVMNIERVINSGKTVFTVKDLKKILDTNNEQTIRNYLSRGGKKSLFQRLYFGVWALNKFNIFEFATKLKKKSYISFETVLQQEGIIFQDYSSLVTLASDNTITKEAYNKKFTYHKIKDSILLDPMGVVHYKTYSMASKERAICDTLYLYPNYYFDNLSSVNYEKLEKISHLYNKRLVLEVKQLIEDAKGR